MTHDKAKEIFSLIGFETTDKDLLQIFCDFARAAQENENEACAKLCEESDRYRGEYFAQLIRARGQHD